MATLDPCPRCARHVHHTAAACPFCGALLLPGWAPPRYEIDPRLPRSTQLLFHALLASAVLVRCNGRPAEHTPIAPATAAHARREIVPTSTADASADAYTDARSHVAVIAEYGSAPAIFEGFQFAPSSTRIEAKDEPMMQDIAILLKARPELQLELHGSDDPGDKTPDLAFRRAQHVRKRLVELGIAEDRLFVFDSDGQLRHPAGDARNRFVRVKIRVPDAG